MKKINQAKPENKEQSAQFIKKAKEIQTDDGKEKFEGACNLILKKKKRLSST